MLLAQLETMARMQEGHNREINADSSFSAVGHSQVHESMSEMRPPLATPPESVTDTVTVELLDHFGWKWWKLQPGDLDQVRLELVDIWHFGLSDLLRDDLALDVLAAALAQLSVPARPDPAGVVGMLA